MPSPVSRPRLRGTTWHGRSESSTLLSPTRFENKLNGEPWAIRPEREVTPQTGQRLRRRVSCAGVAGSVDHLVGLAPAPCARTLHGPFFRTSKTSHGSRGDRWRGASGRHGRRHRPRGRAATARPIPAAPGLPAGGHHDRRRRLRVLRLAGPRRRVPGEPRHRARDRIDVLRLDAAGTRGTAIAHITGPRFRIPTTAAAWGGRPHLPNARFDVEPTPDTEYDVVAVDQV